MNGKKLLTAAAGALIGLVAGFILANSINRSELTTLRAENDRLKSNRTATPGQGAGPGLSEEEINSTIARADQSPGDFEIQRNIGIAIYRYGAMKQDEKIIRRSLPLLERAANLRSNDFDVTLTLANAHFDVGYFTKNNESLTRSRELYTKALAAKPDNVDIRTDLGLTHFLLTPPDYKSAVDEFQKSLAKDPRHEKTLQFMVQALIKQNRSSEAAQYLEQLRSVNPNNESIGELSGLLSGSQPAG
jgi:tetratricopeptide (TPR) repeat protein